MTCQYGVRILYVSTSFMMNQNLLDKFLHFNPSQHNKLCSGIVGEVDQGKDYYIWTHKKFEIGYNENQVNTFNVLHTNAVFHYSRFVCTGEESIVFQACHAHLSGHIFKAAMPVGRSNRDGKRP